MMATKVKRVQKTRARATKPGAAAKSAINGLIKCGAEFHSRGWLFGTSGNASVLLSRRPFRLLITASGRHKGDLSPNDFVIVDETGMPIDERAPRPSAETLLHLATILETDATSVLHTHSVWATIVSDVYFPSKAVSISGYEILKALDGVTSHDDAVNIEIFDNTQNMIELSEQLRTRLTADSPLRHAFLIRGHGVYTWGRDLAEARRHIETLEFLFEVVGRTMTSALPIAKV